MDYRGYSALLGLDGSYSIEEIVGDLIDSLDRLGWTGCHVVGRTMGGMIFPRAALMQPDRFLSGLALTPVPASGFHLDADTQALSTRAADDDEALEARFGFLIGNRHSPGFARATRVRCRAATTRDAYLG